MTPVFRTTEEILRPQAPLSWILFSFFHKYKLLSTLFQALCYELQTHSHLISQPPCKVGVLPTVGSEEIEVK